MATFSEFVREMAKFIEDENRKTPRRLIQNGPATVIIWNDGSKTVSKLHDGDRYDKLVGVLNCVVRRLTDNVGHGVDDNEHIMRRIAMRSGDLDGLKSAREQVGFLIDILDTAIAAIECGEERKERKSPIASLVDNTLSTSAVVAGKMPSDAMAGESNG